MQRHVSNRSQTLFTEQVKPNFLIGSLQPKKTTFQNPPSERVFGIVRPPDPEGARDGEHLTKQSDEMHVVSRHVVPNANKVDL